MFSKKRVAQNEMRTKRCCCYLILSLVFFIWKNHFAFAVKYPVIVGGITGDTLIEGFSLSSANDLFIEAISSDLALVNAADTNIALLKPATSNNWLWAKQLATAEKLLQINFRLSDNGRIALLYESSLLIVVSAADGSVIRAQKSSSYACFLGCTMDYSGSTLNLIGVVEIGGLEYLGIAQSDPDTSVSPSSIIGYQLSTYQLRFSTAQPTDDARYIMSAQTSGQCSLVFSFSSNFAVLDFLYQAFPSELTRIRALHYRSSSANKRCIGYLQKLSASNEFTIFRFGFDGTTPGTGTYFSYQSSFPTSIDFLDFQQESTSRFYLLVHFTSSFQVVLFKGFLSISDSSYTATVVLTNPSQITFCPAFIQVGTPNYYLGGYDPAGGIFFQVGGGGGTHKSSFVYSLQQTEMDVTVQTVSTFDSMGSTPPNTGYMTPVVTSGQPTTTLTISINAETINDVNLKVPTISAAIPPTCLIQYSVPGYPQAQDYFIGQTLTLTIAPTAVDSCSGIGCSYLPVLQTPSSDLILTFNAGTNAMTFSTSSTIRDESHQIVNLVSIFPGSSFSPCGYQYQYLDLYIRNPQIDTVSIPMIIYPISRGPMVETLPAFDNNKGIVGNPQLTIIYELYKSDGSSYNFGLVTSFNPSSRQITIQTSDASLPWLNEMKVVAYFSYNPAQTVEIFFTIKLDKCFATTIAGPTAHDMYYQINQPSLTQALNNPSWSNTYGSYCEPFYFSAAFTAIPAITFSNTDPSLTVSTSLTSADGAYPVTLKAQLLQQVTNIEYTSKILSFNIFIIDPLQSYIIPKPIDDITYILNDTAIQTVLPVFPTSKNYLSAKYILTKADGSNVDPNLLVFNGNTRSLKIYSKNSSHVGVISLILKAFFDPSLTYFVTSSFTLTVHHWCSRNLITAPVIQNVRYYIGDSVFAITLPKFSMTMSQYCTVSISVKQQTGSSLPNFIRYDSNSRILTIYTSQAKNANTYNLMVLGNSISFDNSSTIYSIYTVDIICKTQQLIPLEADLSFTYVKGSSLPLSIPFKSFEQMPKCSSSSNSIVYTADSNLPNQILFDSLNRKFIVQDPYSQLKVGIISIQVSGYLASRPTVRATLSINLKVVQYVDSKGDDIILDTVTIQATAGQEIPLVYASENFTKYTNNPYSMLILDPTITFVKFLQISQQLQIKPLKEDIGIHEVFLLSEQQNTTKKIMQLIIINVVQPEGQLKSKKIEGIIQSVGRSGLVTIDFNQRLVNINHAEEINNRSIAVSITNKAGVSSESLNFTWEAVNFYQDHPSGHQNEDQYQGSRLLIRLKFLDPQQISMEEYDYLTVNILNRTVFKSAEQGIYIQFRYKMMKKIPRQLDTSKSSKYLDYFASLVQSGIDAIAGSNGFIQFIFALVMNTLWGIIKSVQIILLYPLILVDIPPNVQLLYFFMNQNLNIQILPLDFLNFKFFDFESANSSTAQSLAFNDKFDDQDIF